MTSKQHHKHAKLARPSYGDYCRNEWAILGSTCEVIQTLAKDIIAGLTSHWKAVYIDATHKEQNNVTLADPLVAYISHPSNEEFRFNRKFTAFNFRQQFNDADFALINGNHFTGKAQLVILDEIKRPSLEKRAAQFTDVQLFLVKDHQTEPFDFLKSALPHWKEIPMISLADKDGIISFMEKKMKEALPVLNALVLAGGQSVRMGEDKTSMHWHGKEQRYYMADMLKPFAKEVFISCRAGQEENIHADYKSIADSFVDLGPYGAILSAFRFNPDAAWLVIASDLPLLDAATITMLVENRKPAAMATTYSGADQQPEPLITIWEPKSYSLLLANLAQGYSCPRKLLINNDVHVLTATDVHALMNVNTPEEAREAKQLLELKLSST